MRENKIKVIMFNLKCSECPIKHCVGSCNKMLRTIDDKIFNDVIEVTKNFLCKKIDKCKEDLNILNEKCE